MVPIDRSVNTPACRLESDALGEVAVPEGVLYGVHTVRAIENFGVSGVRMADCPELVSALGAVKAAAAGANSQVGALPSHIAGAVIEAAREVARGEHDDQFPIDVVQGGGGTAANMNANEVIANRASELLGGRLGTYDLVHPNDHVNRSQSTNDVYPTALALAANVAGARTIAALRHLAEQFHATAERFGSMERLGRTCLRDAVPLTVGETHHAHGHAVSRAAAELQRSLTALLAVPLGATAVGTGVGAPRAYRDHALRFLAEESGLPVRGADDLFDALAHVDGYVDVSAQLVRAALVMAKIAADLRFLSSGPMGGIGEVALPAVQVGSSIMPGKVNPVIPELVMQVSYEVRGAGAAIEAAVAAGELELNVMEPVIARQLLFGLRDVARAATIFADRCVVGLSWNGDVVAEHLAGSLQGAVEAAAEHGYAAVAKTRETP